MAITMTISNDHGTEVSILCIRHIFINTTVQQYLITEYALTMGPNISASW